MKQEAQLSICAKCKAEYELLGDMPIVEALCRACQTQLRIKLANDMHKTGQFTKHTAWWKYNGLWNR